MVWTIPSLWSRQLIVPSSSVPFVVAALEAGRRAALVVVARSPDLLGPAVDIGELGPSRRFAELLHAFAPFIRHCCTLVLEVGNARLLSWAGSPSLLATPVSTPSIRVACRPFASLPQTPPMVCRLCPSPVFTSFTPMWSARPSPT
ncbi:hypothetical protein C8J57DRAFT_1387046, partial [Mycena rebaudengoi]